jgi:hypothetical protein
VRGGLLRYFIPGLCFVLFVYLGVMQGPSGVVVGLFALTPLLVLGLRCSVFADDQGVVITNFSTRRIGWADVGDVHISRQPNGYYLLFRLRDGTAVTAYATSTYFATKASRMRAQIASVGPERLRAANV